MRRKFLTTKISQITVCTHAHIIFFLKFLIGCFSYQQQSLSEPGKLTQFHHGSLLSQLSQYATKWRDIGAQLGFLPGELSNIEASPNLMQGAPVSWLGAMLAQWLQRTSSPTLEDLKSALSKAGLAAAAHDLKL